VNRIGWAETETSESSISVQPVQAPRFSKAAPLRFDNDPEFLILQVIPDCSSVRKIGEMLYVAMNKNTRAGSGLILRAEFKQFVFKRPV
jgi:hypothetical protein